MANEPINNTKKEISIETVETVVKSTEDIKKEVTRSTRSNEPKNETKDKTLVNYMGEIKFQNLTQKEAEEISIRTGYKIR